MTLSRQIVINTFTHALATIEANEAELGKLDAAAGDGDHGAGMVRGMRAANKALAEADVNAPLGMLLMQAGSAFSDAAGGASGALFGIFFMTIGQKLGSTPADANALQSALQASLDAIAKLGKAKPGDKTMLDTLAPFVTALADLLSPDVTLRNAWHKALIAAEIGAFATREMQARRGRSSRLGERSIGHVDPGAMSMLYILQAVGAAFAAS